MVKKSEVVSLTVHGLIATNKLLVIFMHTKVPLGIYLKGKQKYEEMVEVLGHLHQYVPTVTTREMVKDPSSQRTDEVVIDAFDTIGLGMSTWKADIYPAVCVHSYFVYCRSVLVGGDHMTVARTRGSQRIRSNAERGKERLMGLTPGRGLAREAVLNGDMYCLCVAITCIGAGESK